MQDKYNDIRELLDRWYAGETSPDEQRRLMNFFSEERSLPDDLEEERALFEALGATGEVKMPDKYSDRIDAAMRREMSRKSLRMRMAYMVTSAAACVALLWGGYSNLLREDAKPVQLADNKTEIRQTAAPVVTDDTVTVVHLAPVQSTMIAKAKPVKSRKVVKPEIPAEVTETTELADYEYNGYDDYELPAEERERLIAANYRIVESDEEARAIATTVFMRMDNQMTAVHADIDAMEADRSSQFMEF